MSGMLSSEMEFEEVGQLTRGRGQRYLTPARSARQGADNGQTGSYQPARRVSTDKRAYAYRLNFIYLVSHIENLIYQHSTCPVTAFTVRKYWNAFAGRAFPSIAFP
jgi:hypothetical protein